MTPSQMAAVFGATQAMEVLQRAEAVAMGACSVEVQQDRMKEQISILPDLSREELVGMILAEKIARPPDSTPDTALRRVLKKHFIGNLRQMFVKKAHLADNLSSSSELSERYLAGAATVRPAGVNPTVAALQASSGWRQPGAAGENATAELTALRNYGCDLRVDIRATLSWAEFRDDYVRQANRHFNPPEFNP